MPSWIQIPSEAFTETSVENIYNAVTQFILILLAGFLFTLILKRITRFTLLRLASKTKSETDDYVAWIIIGAIKPLCYLATFIIAWEVFPISESIDVFVYGLIKLIVLVILIRLINKILFRLIQRMTLKIDDTSISNMLRALTPMIRAVVWSIGSVFYLQNMGVQMAAIWALLSAGGIGAGLALREPVLEFFEYITILLDKPFQNGEFINIGDVWATVERVGVRSTRLRSLNGEVIVMSNSSLMNGTISNYAQMKKRRIVHRLGVVYETSQENMTRIPSLIKTIVEKTEGALFDRCHFVEFGSFSLDFELVYCIPTNDYLLAMNAQEQINLEIMRIFEYEQIQFAFPTSTININRAE
ncbi:mechanosensitive ion channel family protein [Prochlorococcus sp. MIT 1300]|uniref:mechanosensitive ion channel family protein n=1 Tax=Prochlorococcus sp. MIT 1300 TaxID=3096218 RepID=UPI002A75D45C|nr:mechanosensitive ion channel domain-containing protein [Prochlorococcus sp. MIT 1300]